jgi:hypothetical protein
LIKVSSKDIVLSAPQNAALFSLLSVLCWCISVSWLQTYCFAWSFSIVSQQLQLTSRWLVQTRHEIYFPSTDQHPLVVGEPYLVEGYARLYAACTPHGPHAVIRVRMFRSEVEQSIKLANLSLYVSTCIAPTTCRRAPLNHVLLTTRFSKAFHAQRVGPGPLRMAPTSSTLQARS